MVLKINELRFSLMILSELLSFFGCNLFVHSFRLFWLFTFSNQAFALTDCLLFTFPESDVDRVYFALFRCRTSRVWACSPSTTSIKTSTHKVSRYFSTTTRFARCSREQHKFRESRCSAQDDIGVLQGCATLPASNRFALEQHNFCWHLFMH